MTATPRLLFVTQTAHPWGGVESWLETLASALPFDVTVGLVRGRFHDPDAYRAARRRLPPTIEVEAPTGTTEGRVRALVRAIETTKAEMVIPANVADAFEAVRRVKQRRDVRLIDVLHGIGSDYLLDLRTFAPIVDRVVSGSRLALRAATELAGAQRTSHIAYGAEAPLERPSFDVHDTLELIFAGRLTQEQKRVRDLMPLVRELDARGVRYRLRIAGTGDEEASLRAHLPQAEFLGLLSHDELYRNVYPNADAMLLLSDWETGPIVAWEAMRHGATLVTSRYLGLTTERTLVDGETALVAEIGDVAAMAHGVERLANDVELRMRLRRNAYERATRLFDMQSHLHAWAAVIGETLATPPANGRVTWAPRPQGRLDRLVGITGAESLRAMLGRRMEHTSAGAEWPHTLHHDDPRRAEIDGAIAELER